MADRRPHGDDPVFYYDFNSPFAWLAAERVTAVLGRSPRWQPISFSHILKATRRLPWSLTAERETGMREVERRASDRGFARLTWPAGWPAQTIPLIGLRAATFAANLGRAEAFCLAAFRRTFLTGRAMHRIDNVLLAATDADLDPHALNTGLGTDSVKRALVKATEDALELGVTGVPSVVVGDQLFWGDDRLEEAAAALAQGAGGRPAARRSAVLPRGQPYGW
jgi:2-hydroxychromene-2-carboxylate isomerase